MTNCSLEKEHIVPKGYTILYKTAIFNTVLTGMSNDTLSLKAYVNNEGFTIKQHGWVWAKKRKPTYEMNIGKLELGRLEVDSDQLAHFQSKIENLNPGEIYYFKPYVIADSVIIYGREIHIDFLKLGELVNLNISACNIDLRCSVKSLSPIKEYGAVYIEGEGAKPTIVKGIKVSGNLLKDTLFSVELLDLKPSTTYSIRAYAIRNDSINEDSTKDFVYYNKTIQIKTPSSPNVQLDFDIDTDTLLFQGAMVNFANNSKGEAQAYQWSFGDGGKESTYSTSHIFKDIGNFTTALEAEKSGCKFRKEVKFRVDKNPFEEDYWVKLPGGDFKMGCDNCKEDEKPAHAVTLSPFEIGKTEITRAQWLAVMGYSNKLDDTYARIYGSNLPVVTSNYFTAQYDFVNALNRKTGRKYRLPTEAEWEYAARAGKAFSYSGSDDINEVGWYDGNSGDLHPHAVATKKPNSFGLYDMSGNVSELCLDNYDPNFYSRGSATGNDPLFKFVKDPTLELPTDYPQVIRGGSFKDGARTNSSRGSVSSRSIGSSVGFRLVRF